MTITRRCFLVVFLIAVLGGGLFLADLERSIREAGENYSLIEEGLYMGGAVAEPPRGTRAVLNLCEKPDSYRVDLTIWESIPDTAPGPSIAWLRRMVGFLDSQRRAGLMTYVHCRNGVSRSGLVVTAYLMAKNHWNRDEALAFVRSKRPQVRPHSAFRRLLLEWEQVLKDQHD